MLDNKRSANRKYPIVPQRWCSTSNLVIHLRGMIKLDVLLIECLREQLYQIVNMHRFNFLHPDVISKSEELDFLISEVAHI